METTVQTENVAFSYDGYQVVRGEFFAHLAEPSFTFNRYKIYVNTACIRKAAETEFIQILINQTEKKMLVRPAQEYEKDSFAWRTRKHKPRQVTCQIFFGKVMELMGWNPDWRYKLLGKEIMNGAERLFIFDLTEAAVFPRTPAVGRRCSHAPQYPESWKNQFGLPVEAHRKAFQVDRFDKFAVFHVGTPAPTFRFNEEVAAKEGDANDQ